MNLYWPLNFIRNDQMIASVFGPKRSASIPKFEIWKLEEELMKGAVATPPPDRKC